MQAEEASAHHERHGVRAGRLSTERHRAGGLAARRPDPHACASHICALAVVIHLILCSSSYYYYYCCCCYYHHHFYYHFFFYYCYYYHHYNHYYYHYYHHPTTTTTRLPLLMCYYRYRRMGEELGGATQVAAQPRTLDHRNLKRMVHVGGG